MKYEELKLEFRKFHPDIEYNSITFDTFKEIYEPKFIAINMENYVILDNDDEVIELFNILYEDGDYPFTNYPISDFVLDYIASKDEGILENIKNFDNISNEKIEQYRHSLNYYHLHNADRLKSLGSFDLNKLVEDAWQNGIDSY